MPSKSSKMERQTFADVVRNHEDKVKEKQANDSRSSKEKTSRDASVEDRVSVLEETVHHLTKTVHAFLESAQYAQQQQQENF